MFILKKNKKILKQGFTLVELLVVLSISAILGSIIIFNYQGFLAKVNIKALANDVAIKLVEVQKYSASGKENTSASTTWKPSYGLYFNLTNGANTSNKIFYSFVDLDQDKNFDAGSYTCPASECVEKINITKNNIVSELRVVYIDGSSTVVPNLTVSFMRPSLGATIRSTTSLGSNISYAQITVSSPTGSVTTPIKLYVSGRIQIN